MRANDGIQTSRRTFLVESAGGIALLAGGASAQQGGGAGGVATDPATSLLPTVQLGPHRITRLIAGYNPIGGFSHTTEKMSRIMREYFTAERTAEFLMHCEQQGLNTWQYDHTPKTIEALRLAREQGSRIQLICLHAERGNDTSLKDVMAQKPLAIVHHGGVTDSLFRSGKAEQVRDFVKKVHDAGALAGVSSHCPDHVKRVADEGWENDLFMCCFYHVSRPREEMRETLGKVPVDEPYFESDPDEMTAVIRQIRQPCLGFKILAAGRRCGSPTAVEGAFQYAFSNIKRTDAVIVGMFPLYADEVAQNAEYARKHGAV